MVHFLFSLLPNYKYHLDCFKIYSKENKETESQSSNFKKKVLFIIILILLIVFGYFSFLDTLIILSFILMIGGLISIIFWFLKKVDKNDVEKLFVFKASNKELEDKILNNIIF